jgi:hypothetical protein
VNEEQSALALAARNATQHALCGRSVIIVPTVKNDAFTFFVLRMSSSSGVLRDPGRRR